MWVVGWCFVQPWSIFPLRPCNTLSAMGPRPCGMEMVLDLGKGARILWSEIANHHNYRPLCKWRGMTLEQIGRDSRERTRPSIKSSNGKSRRFLLGKEYVFFTSYVRCTVGELFFLKDRPTGELEHLDFLQPFLRASFLGKKSIYRCLVHTFKPQLKRWIISPLNWIQGWMVTRKVISSAPNWRFSAISLDILDSFGSFGEKNPQNLFRKEA